MYITHVKNDFSKHNGSGVYVLNDASQMRSSIYKGTRSVCPKAHTYK